MRQIIEYSKMAFRNIIGNKMRSLLTMLGIIIGIAAVIIVLCIGSGGQKSMQDQLSGISNGSVYIYMGGEDMTRADYMTDGDVEALKKIPGISGVSMVTSTNGTARGTREDVNASITAGNEDLNLVMPSTIEKGRLWNEGDYASARKVCTIDSKGAQELFGSDNVVGMKIQLTVNGRTNEFTIIGITKSTEMSFSRTVTAQISVPISSLAGVTEAMAEPYYQIMLLGEDTTKSGQLAQQAVNTLELRHGNAGRDNYAIMDVSAYMSEINSVMGLFTTIIAAIAAISLLVGGIGVMNIMLVSVTERTREIGIRKALGAKTRTIMFQFLVESATLTFVGGVIGIVLGVWGGIALGGVMGIQASIDPVVVIGIALISSSIGIFFGIYPARKAARLNPIEALRSD
ncbi:ABC transporter permease [Ruminococcaceae bacterium OttesenSCG-928-A16]|nr:ABC transporter permease [Ruminococcaceae bacterium OttesenSCG-928-A16]